MAPGNRSILPGTVELLILRILRDAPAHGLGISRTLRARSEGVIALQDGALYQALHRMENEGLLSSDWGHAESGKRAKFYQIAPEGGRRLTTEVEAWHRYAQAAAQVLGPDFAPEGGR